MRLVWRSSGGAHAEVEEGRGVRSSGFGRGVDPDGPASLGTGVCCRRAGSAGERVSREVRGPVGRRARLLEQGHGDFRHAEKSGRRIHRRRRASQRKRRARLTGAVRRLNTFKRVEFIRPRCGLFSWAGLEQIGKRCNSALEKGSPAEASPTGLKDGVYGALKRGTTYGKKGYSDF